MTKHEGALFEEVKKHFGGMAQGTMNAVLEMLDEQDDALLGEEDLRVKQDYQGHFSDFSPPELPEEDPILVSLLAIYQKYWVRVLTAREERKIADEALHAKVRDWCNEFGAAAPPPAKNDDEGFDSTEALVKNILKPLGYYALLGVVRPYRELIVWKKQTEKYFSVVLHDDEARVKMLFLDDFVSYGWLGYASFGVMRVGGWAKEDVIVQTNPEPEDLADEKFTIDILAHEGRHYSDYSRFPALEQSGLEYRAKLTELSMAEESLQRRIANFVASGSPDKDAPHALAAYHLMRDLCQALFDDVVVENTARWEALESDAIRESAREILDQNTKMLNAEYDPKMVRHWFPEDEE